MARKSKPEPDTRTPYERRREAKLKCKAAFQAELKDIEERLYVVAEKMLNEDRGDEHETPTFSADAYGSLALTNEHSKSLINDAMHSIRAVRNGVSDRRR